MLKVKQLLVGEDASARWVFLLVVEEWSCAHIRWRSEMQVARGTAIHRHGARSG
jgi:hypothetical protein